MSEIDSIAGHGIGKSLKNRSRMNEAVEVQDKLREKSSDWSGEDEIKKWRKKR